MYRVITTNAALAIAALPALALAQSAPAEDAVVITASRTEQPVRDAIPHTTILTRKDISDSQAVDLPSLLQREAGFEYTQNGGRGAVPGLLMRGGRSAQTPHCVHARARGAAAFRPTER